MKSFYSIVDHETDEIRINLSLF